MLQMSSYNIKTHVLIKINYEMFTTFNHDQTELTSCLVKILFILNPEVLCSHYSGWVD